MYYVHTYDVQGTMYSYTLYKVHSTSYILLPNRIPVYTTYRAVELHTYIVGLLYLVALYQHSIVYYLVSYEDIVSWRSMIVALALPCTMYYGVVTAETRASLVHLYSYYRWCMHHSHHALAPQGTEEGQMKFKIPSVSVLVLYYVRTRT